MTGERLDVTSRRAGSTVEVVAGGELDVASAPALLEQANEHLDGEGASVVLDLSGVSFIDSSGLHALMTISEQRPERVRIVPSEACRRLFEIAGVQDRLPLTDVASGE
jgi:anti-anti-sigma factor